MAALNEEKVKKLRRGEIAGTVATAFCAAVVVYFAVCFTVANVNGFETLLTVVWATAPALLALGVAAAAYCNLKFGGGLEKEIKKYVTETLIENAARLHPERNSLSFFVTIDNPKVIVTANGYKETVEFDFSVFGKLTPAQKMTVGNAVCDKIAASFFKLYERGGEYKSVEYVLKDVSRTKPGKPVPVIADGTPDVKSYKRYLKQR